MRCTHALPELALCSCTPLLLDLPTMASAPYKLKERALHKSIDSYTRQLSQLRSRNVSLVLDARVVEVLVQVSSEIAAHLHAHGRASATLKAPQEQGNALVQQTVRYGGMDATGPLEQDMLRLDRCDRCCAHRPCTPRLLPSSSCPAVHCLSRALATIPDNP